MSRWREVKKGEIRKVENRKLKVKGSKTTSSTLKVATISSRLKAFLTDTFLITTPIFYIVIYLVIGSLQEFATQRAYGWSLILGSSFAIIALFWIIKGQTPGLKAYDLKITTTNKKKINILQAIVRYFATLFTIASIFLLFIPFFRQDKRTFQDIVSQTYIAEE